MKRLPALLVWSVLISGGGCARVLGDNQPREANAEVPGGFGMEGDFADAGGTTSLAAQQWAQLFTDPHLSALINDALENNQELNMQIQETIIAQSEVGARKGEYLPTLDAGAGVGVEKVGGDTSQGVSDEGHGLPGTLANFRFGLYASWEIDVWGRLRKAAKAANLRYRATVEAKNFMVTQIVAELARSYYELIAVDKKIEVLQTYVELTEQALEVVRQKKAAARATELAVQRFEAELSRSQGRIFALEQERVVLQNQINFLVGRYPQPVARGSELLDEAALAKVNQTGLPAELLDNRTDVRRAEMVMEAAELDAKSAKARFYPSLTLDAGVGYESFNPAHLLRTPESLVFGAGASLLAPLLNRAAIKADYRAANARQIQAVFEFEQTILRAYTEVANELSRIDNLRQSYERFSDQVATLEKAVEVSNILYRSAHADYMEVLLTRRDALEAHLDLIETELDRMKAMVTLYQALGGGWR